MLIAALVVSTLMLLLVNVEAYRNKNANTSITLICVFLGLGPSCLLFFSPPVVLQAVLIGLALPVWRMRKRGAADFLKLSFGATTVAYAVAIIPATQMQAKYSRLRAKYPYESMESRVPTPRNAAPLRPLPQAVAVRLDILENTIGEVGSSYRRFQLQRLHEDAVWLFINSPGFGVTRMSYPNEYGLTTGNEDVPTPPQPGAPLATSWSPGSLDPVPKAEARPLGELHEDSLLDFVNPRGFGLVMDRHHVAGFEPHRFRRIPEPSGRWKVQSIELVSLLLHEEPAVYVSDKLPAMIRSHDLPTRPLNEFEEFGLHALRNGDDLFSSREPAGVRLLGALRSTRQCVACHGGTRGDLLGAFSYTLSFDPTTLGLLLDAP